MYNKEKVILTDCDGVLLDWGHAFFAWMTERGYKMVDGYEEIYHIDKIFGIERSESKPLVRAFNESAWMRDLTPLNDAVKYVRKLYEEGGYVFHVITSQTEDVKAQNLRKENLVNVFGEGIFEEIVCLPTGGDKDEALEKYRDSGCYWVEDKVENSDLGVDMGLSSLLIAHGHNVDYDGDATRVANWKEIYNIVMG